MHEGLPEFPGWEPLERVRRSFTSALRRAGYWTGYVTDNPFLAFTRPYEPLRESFDSFVRRGGQVGGRATGVSQEEIRHWIPDWLAAQPELRLRTIRYLANGGYEHDETRSFSARVFRSAGDQLEAARRERRPFALVVDTFEPHEPWTPPRKYVDMYGDPDYRGVEPVRQLNLPADRYLPDGERELMLERMRALYAAEVTLTDRWLGVFMDRLHDLRLDGETIVVLVSDHGFFLGEHGLTGKLHEYLHPELTHVPLIWVDPAGRRAGEQEGYRASTHDIGPTLLAMAGVEPPESMEGSTCRPSWTATEHAGARALDRRLLGQLLHPHRRLGAARAEQAGRLPAVRPAAGPGRAAQRRRPARSAGARAASPRGGDPRRPAAVLRRGRIARITRSG